jgi:hypothetical protein
MAWRLASTAAVAVMAGAIGRAEADTVVYATGSVGNPSVFGTLDQMTGQFTEIAGLDRTMVSPTSRPGGTFYTLAMSGNPCTFTTSGVETQFGSATAPLGFGGRRRGIEWYLCSRPQAGFLRSSDKSTTGNPDGLGPKFRGIVRPGAVP